MRSPHRSRCPPADFYHAMSSPSAAFAQGIGTEFLAHGVTLSPLAGGFAVTDWFIDSGGLPEVVPSGLNSTVGPCSDPDQGVVIPCYRIRIPCSDLQGILSKSAAISRALS